MAGFLFETRSKSWVESLKKKAKVPKTNCHITTWRGAKHRQAQREKGVEKPPPPLRIDKFTIFRSIGPLHQHHQGPVCRR